jgi:CubicO group peptidase (beta-lactamase class C family)
MAIGAPSEGIVDPMFLASGVLALLFGIGVLRQAKRYRTALKITAWLLIAGAVAGFGGPTLFEMHPREITTMQAERPHIVMSSILGLVMLLATLSGSFALGRRFRSYSIVTLAAMISFGALMVPYTNLAALGEPTPGWGIIERVMIYSWMLWSAVLAIALLQKIEQSAETRPIPINGFTAPGFEEVRREFERNFAERGDIGAAVAAFWHGEKVVDLWGGYRTLEKDDPWREDTIVPVMSTTKGIAAITLAVANARGWLEYDVPVARYWPEFAQNGKSQITVRQLLGHEAGLILLDEEITLEKLRDFDYMAQLLARQKPAWPPGTRHGYHTMTIGLYMQELIRRVDPLHRTFGQFFRDEVAGPLGADFHIGLPKSIPARRIATLKTLSRTRALLALRNTPAVLIRKILAPNSLVRRTMIFQNLDMNDRRTLEIELPAGNGVGTARAIARLYSALAEGGEDIGLTRETFERVTEIPDVADPTDFVLGLPSYFSLGFMRPGPEVWFGSSEKSLGAPGAGGSFAFADPDAHVGYAYVMNKMDFYLADDPREKALRNAIYRVVNRVSNSRPAGQDSSYPSAEVLLQQQYEESQELTASY